VDEDFDTASFDEAYDISDFGDDQAFSTADMAPVTTTFGGGNFVDTGAGGGDSIASILNPALGGGNRTNITNVGAGSNLVYDPAFAAALDISQGLDPTLNLGGTGGVMVPASLRPQIPGQFMTADLGEADMVRPMFNSQLERILQQTIPEAIKEGPVGRIATGIGNFFGDLFSEGKEFAKDPAAGIKLPSLNEISEGFKNFMNRFKPVDRDTQTGRPIEPRGTELGDMTTTNAFIPDARVVVDNFNRPLARTVAPIFPSDMNQVPMLGVGNTGGITTTRPNMAQEADMEVADALQLVPSEFQDTPTDLGSGIRIVPGSGANRFKFTTSTGANLPGLNLLGNVFDIIDARNLEKEVGRLTDEEREFLAGRRNRIVGTPPRFVTTTPNFSVPGFRSRSMSEKEAEEIKRRLGVS